MQPYRVIVHMEIKSDGLSTIPDEPNTLTYQSTSINNACRNPLHSPVIMRPFDNIPNGVSIISPIPLSPWNTHVDHI